ncbi:hypothetical protein D3C87_1312300 [compost metagenome]
MSARLLISNEPSMVASVAPVRMVSLEALPPIKRAKLFKRTDLPAPVSPLKMFKPFLKVICRFSIIAKFETFNSSNIAVPPRSTFSNSQ